MANESKAVPEPRDDRREALEKALDADACESWPGLPGWEQNIPRRWDKLLAPATRGHIYLRPHGSEPHLEVIVETATGVRIIAGYAADLSPEDLLRAMRWCETARTAVEELAQRLEPRTDEAGSAR